MKLMSLFDGSGGFPLAASLCGIEPVYAAEVEPYPIAVTKNRFPKMKHLGDVSKVKGGEIEPVDIITFGSPCQDMSIAGKRAGLKHADIGDEETTRSGLFLEAIRIIKEISKNSAHIKMRLVRSWQTVTLVAIPDKMPIQICSLNVQDFKAFLICGDIWTKKKVSLMKNINFGLKYVIPTQESITKPLKTTQKHKCSHGITNCTATVQSTRCGVME